MSCGRASLVVMPALAVALVAVGAPFERMVREAPGLER